MSFRSLCARGAVVVAAVMALYAVNASAQTVTVVEYYNKTLDAYFISGRTSDQTALDGVADFQRTGMTFQAVAAVGAPASLTQVCRFYISIASPYVSSHFYGRQGIDCESLQAQKLPGFTYEGFDFAIAQPGANGTCAAGTTAIYRGFRAAAGGKTSNHRYSASLATYNTAVTAGYLGENIAFCATSATAAGAVVSPPVAGSGDCGVLFLSKKAITSQTTVSVFGFSSTTTSTVAFDYDLTPVTFNGRSAARQFATTTGASNSNVSTPGVSFFQDNANDYTSLGSRDTSKSPVQDTYFEPPLVYPKLWTTGQKVDYNHAIVFNPSQSIGNGTQIGTATFLGMESVTVPAGTFNACKFKVDQTTRYPGAGSTSVTSFTSWSVPNVGNVKSEGTDTSTVPAAGTVTSNYLIVATAIQ